jgi:hypothetical protein
MADIFQAKRGTVIRSDQSGPLALVSLDGLPDSTLLMLTDVRASRKQIVQYLR